MATKRLSTNYLAYKGWIAAGRPGGVFKPPLSKTQNKSSTKKSKK